MNFFPNNLSIVGRSLFAVILLGLSLLGLPNVAFGQILDIREESGFPPEVRTIYNKGAAFLANNFLSAPVEKQVVEVNNVSMTPVLVALQNIDVGEKLTSANVGWKDWPSDEVRQFMIAKPGNEDFFEKMDGSRARALAITGDPLASEPDCLYTPQAFTAEL